MARKLWSVQALPSGETRLVLHPRPGPRESTGWTVGSAALALVGLWLLSSGHCFFGLVVAATSGFMLLSLWRALTRKEAWVVGPGTARRELGVKKDELTLVRRLRFEAERDSDDRELLRLFVVHGAGETQLGEDWERDDDLEGLTDAMSRALGVPVDPLPPPTRLPPPT